MLITPLIKYYINQMQIWSKDSKPLQRVVLIMLFVVVVVILWSFDILESRGWRFREMAVVWEPVFDAETNETRAHLLPAPCIRLLQSGTPSLCPKSPQGQVLDNQGSPWSRRACQPYSSCSVLGLLSCFRLTHSFPATTTLKAFVHIVFLLLLQILEPGVALHGVWAPSSQ